MSLKTPVLGTYRSRVTLPSVFICQRRLKMFWMQKIIIFIFCVFKVLQCIFVDILKKVQATTYVKLQALQFLHKTFNKKKMTEKN